MKNEDIRAMGVDEIPFSMDVYILLDVINRLNDTKALIDKEYVKNLHSGITKGIGLLNVLTGGSQDEN